jgi:hypothetical protein
MRNASDQGDRMRLAFILGRAQIFVAAFAGHFGAIFSEIGNKPGASTVYPGVIPA